MSAALQGWLGGAAAVLTALGGVFQYSRYRTRRDRITLVGQAFVETVNSLSSEAETKQLAAAVLLRRFFDKGTEQGAAGTPYEREAVAVIAALLRGRRSSELQKLLADGLAYASSLQAADLQRCNLSNAYLGQRPRAAVTHGGARLLRGRVDQTSLSRSETSEAAVSQAPVNLAKADLFQAELIGTSLRGAIARDTVFFSADASNAVFEDAHLEGANFREAKLGGARFAGAFIGGADFHGAQDLAPNVLRLLDAAGRVQKGDGGAVIVEAQ